MSEELTEEGLQDTVGTAMYVAPEIAGGKKGGTHSYQVDWWGLGCVLYEMIVGSAPFGDSDRMSKFEIFNNINNRSVSLPLSMNSALAELIRGLLHKNPVKRSSWKEVKSSSWVNDIDWNALYEKKIAPPWRPPMTPEPSRDNFVKWHDKDVEIPVNASQKVVFSCSLTTILLLRFIIFDTIRHYNIVDK